MRLIHLSDPHLTNPEHPLSGRSHWGKRYLGRGSWRRRRRFRHRREWLDDLVKAVSAEQPDLILVTGDLAHIGLPEEIEEAAEWLRQLGSPDRVVVVPGNHDDYAADSRAALNEHWGPYFGLSADYPMCREFADLELICVDTALPTRPASACGLVGERQLSSLLQHLSGGQAKPRLLAIHHPPFPGMIGFRKRLRDAQRLETLIHECPVDLIVHGHDHKDRREVRHGVRVFGTSSASYEAGSYRCIDVVPDASGWQLRMRLLRRDDGSFHCVEDEHWLKPAGADHGAREPALSAP